MLTGWKKTAVCALIIFFTCRFCAATVSASGRDAPYGDEELQLPTEIEKILSDPDAADGTVAANEISVGYFLRAVIDGVNLCFGDVLKNTALMLGAMVMSALVNTYCRGGGLSSALGRTAGFVSVICLGMTYYSAAKIAWDSAKGAIDAMTLIMSALLPGVVASCTASGEVALSTVTSTGITLLLAFFERLCADGFMPLLNVCFALSLANGLADGEGANLVGVVKFVKNTFAILMGALMAVFCVSVIYRTNLAKTADGLLLRSVRFASGSFVPIIGGALGEASASILGSLSAIKANVGTAASVAVAVATIPKLTELLLYRLAFGFCSGSAGLLGCGRDSGFIAELGSLLSYGIVMVISCGVMLLISLAMVSGG